MDEMQSHPLIEVQQQTQAYFDGNALASSIWITHYAKKDRDGNLYEKSPADMFARITAEIERIEQRYPQPVSEESILGVLEGFRYAILSGSEMQSLGNAFSHSPLSNSYVIGLEGNSDSYGAIMRIDEEQVQLMKRRGGVGHDLSSIRPSGSEVNNAALTSTGLVPFMERYSHSAREVAQVGHRGALMLTASLTHPDSDSFISAKSGGGNVWGTRLAVSAPDSFFAAAERDRRFKKQFPVQTEQPTQEKEASARKQMERLAHEIWNVSEPSILFADTIERSSLGGCYIDSKGQSVSASPYGCVPQDSYDTCPTLYLNLYSYVNHPFTSEAQFDKTLFTSHIAIAMRMLDDLVDINIEKFDALLDKIQHSPEGHEAKEAEYHLWEKIKLKAQRYRKVGLGTTGLADMLAALHLSYDSDEARACAEEVYRTLAIEAYRASIGLAKERGAFDAYNPKREEQNAFIIRLREAAPDLYQEMAHVGRRNLACLSVSPTGNASVLAQTTYGIEPIVVPAYIHRFLITQDMVGVHADYIDEVGDAYAERVIYHRPFRQWMEVSAMDTNVKFTHEALQQVIDQSPYKGSTQQEVDPLRKVQLQGVIQQWTDQSVSATIYLPTTADEQAITQVVLAAWHAGCKTCVIYREGSQADVFLSASSRDRENALAFVEAHVVSQRLLTQHHFMGGASPMVMENRPKELICDVVRFQNNKEKWVAFVGLLDGRPYEIFTGLQDDEEGIALPKTVTKGKIIRQTNPNGSHRYDFQFSNKRGYKTTVEGLSEKFNPEYWNYAKLISGVLRYRMPIQHVIKLVGSLSLKNESINTWKTGVERALKKYIGNGTKAPGQRCPVCGNETLVYQEGSMNCRHCGANLSE